MKTHRILLLVVCLLCAFIADSGASYAASVKVNAATEKKISRAKQAWRDSQFKFAIKLFNEVLVKYPDNAESLFYLGRIYLGKNFFKKGVDFLRRSVEASPKNTVLHLNLARVYEESDFFYLAVDEYEKVMDLVKDTSDPVYKEAQRHHRLAQKEHESRLKKVQPYLNKGKALYAKSTLDEALKNFIKVLDTYPTYAETYYFLGNIFLKKGDFGAGLKHMETSRWNAPGNVRVQLTLARVYEEGRQFDDAEKEYNDVIKRLGMSAPESQEAQRRLKSIREKRKKIEAKAQEVVELLKAGKTLFSANKPDDAEVKLKAVIALDIGRAEAYYYLGRIELAKGEYRKGGEYIEKGVQYSPRNLGLIMTLARTYEEGGMTTNASKYYNRALFYADPESDQAKEAKKRLSLMGAGSVPRLLQLIDEKPLDITSRVQLAQAYIQSKKINEAIGQLEAIVAIGGDEEIIRSAHVNLAVIYSSYGKSFIDAGRIIDARSLFEQARQHDPNNSNALYFLGIAYAKTNQLDKAIESLQAAVTITPDYYEAYENLALAYRMQKKYDQAMEAYSLAVASDTNVLTAKINVLRILDVLVKKYREEKQVDKIIEILTLIVELDPASAGKYIGLMQLYSAKKQWDKVVFYGEKVLQRMPKNTRIRMWVAQTYMSMGEIEKAKTHLLRVSRSTPDKKIQTQAENILAQVERSQKLRFNYSLNYAVSTSGSFKNPSANLPSSSSLSLRLASAFAIKDMRISLTLAPRYSVNHVTQTDSFNVGFTASSFFYPYYKFPLTLGYSYGESGALLTEIKNSYSQTVFASPRPLSLKVPKKYWLLDDGGVDRDEKNVTLTLSTQASYTDSNLFSGVSIFLLRTLSVNTSLRQSYRSFGGRRGSFSMVYLFSDSRNKHILGSDLAFKKNQLQLSMSQRLFFKVSAGINYRIGFDNYTNRDSSVGEHRRVLLQAASASLSRRLFKEMSASVAYSWSKQASNMGRSLIRDSNGQPVAQQPGNFGSRESAGGSWSSSLNFNFRF